jgi:hypothetical protein
MQTDQTTGGLKSLSQPTHVTVLKQYKRKTKHSKYVRTTKENQQATYRAGLHPNPIHEVKEGA